MKTWTIITAALVVLGTEGHAFADCVSHYKNDEPRGCRCSLEERDFSE
jgi:hypothetical protein